MNNSSGRIYLIFTHEFFPHSGGIATYNWELAQALTNGGSNVTVLTSEQSRREMCLHPFPVRHIHYPRFLRPLMKWRVRILFSIIGLLWTVLKVNPDIILATSGEAHICVGLMSQLLRVKYVLVVHGSEVLDYFSSPQIGSVLKGEMKRVYRKAMAESFCE